jgi:hypothetical protein
LAEGNSTGGGTGTNIYATGKNQGTTRDGAIDGGAGRSVDDFIIKITDSLENLQTAEEFYSSFMTKNQNLEKKNQKLSLKMIIQNYIINLFKKNVKN